MVGIIPVGVQRFQLYYLLGGANQDISTYVTLELADSSGTGYAIEGFESAGDYDLVGLVFNDYFSGATGTTGNEAVHVLATTGTVNLYVSGGGSATFSVHSEGAEVNIRQPRNSDFN